MPHSLLGKIVSGGQTGVDRAALDVAIFLEIEHGGWCPHGRRAEDGRIPARYFLKQTRARDYSVRTEKNVVESDGTLILFHRGMAGGTELTRKMTLKHRRPVLCIDLETATDVQETQFLQWIDKHHVKVLNVAGPRESTCTGIAKLAERFLVTALREIV